MADDSDRGKDLQPAGVSVSEGDVQRAQALSAKAHQGQVDKAGLPYIGHPTRVVGYLVNPTAEEIIVAWLHDVVEDTAVTLEYVEKEFGPQVAAAVEAITRRPYETHSDHYYARVKANQTALTVKAADLADNTDPERLRLLEPDVRADLQARYAHARHELGIE
jgi:(p)ppGpp synthase/HD superfamily hydrolase